MDNGFPFQFATVNMNDRDERRFAEVSHESVRLMAESAGVELDDDVAALLAEDVCYRLREATQVGAGAVRGRVSNRFGGLLHVTIRDHYVYCSYRAALSS